MFMMNIGGVLVVVLDPVMSMHVGVLPNHWRNVEMVVMAVVVSMGMFVLCRLVGMPMSVTLG
jgi:hypothetical protein